MYNGHSSCYLVNLEKRIRQYIWSILLGPHLYDSVPESTDHNYSMEQLLVVMVTLMVPQTVWK